MLLLACLAGGCSLHSTADRWNGRVGPDGQVVWVKTTTNIGLNLGIVIPVLGSTTIPRMVDTMTGEIAVEGGDRVRVVQSSSENYWFGFPPLTWVLTPVITTVVCDYQPSAEALRRQQERDAPPAESPGSGPEAADGGQGAGTDR